MEPLSPLDSGDPPKYVTERLPGAEVVARVLWIRPGRTEDFALTNILIEVPCLSYLDARTVGSTVYLTFREAVARGLYRHGQEFELAMAHAIEIQSTQEELRRHLVMYYQEEANKFALFEQLKGAMMADIPEGTESARSDELLKRLHRISERHGEKLLRDFDEFQVPSSLEYRTEAQSLGYIACLQQDAQRCDVINEKYPQLGSQQRAFADEMLQHMRNRRNSAPIGDMRRAHGGLFFLKGE